MPLCIGKLVGVPDELDIIPTRVAAEILGGLHVSTISRMVKDGRLTPVMRTGEGSGSVMLFRRSDVAALAVELQAAS